MRLRQILIRLALDLQMPPFTWVVGAYYRLATRAVVRRVRRQPGVRAIYLCGSIARHDVIHGLSDIDFKIFVDGPTDPAARRVIQRQFERLRRWFPMLGPPDEKGIYFLGGFPADYAHYPLVQHLFDERFYRHQLLWGDDVMAVLPLKPAADRDDRALFFWKLKDWTEKVTLLAGSPRICRVQKHYLFYKACCDVGLIWLCALGQAEGLRARDAVMAQLALRLAPEEADWVRRLIRERQSGWRRFETDPESSYLAFKRLLGICVHALFADPAPPGELRFDVVLPGRGRDVSVPDFDELRALVPEAEWTVLPWAFLPRSPFDLAFDGRSVCVLSPSRPLTLAQTVQLRERYRARLRNETVVMVREQPDWHYSVDSVLVDHWLGAAGSDDLLWLALGNGTEVRLTAAQRARVSERFAAFHAQLDAVAGDADLARLEGNDFIRLLFVALRMAVAAHEFAEGRIWLETTPEAIVTYLKTRTRMDGRYLDRVCEARRSADTGVRFNERLRAKGVRLLQACCAADRSDWHEAWEVLDGEADERRLSMSAVIVTRNRPVQLARCLPTLIAQHRVPDELIVVDSSADDVSADIVTRMDAPFPVRLVRRGSSPGVAAARNAGVRAATHDVIAFVDDDAVLEPGWLEALEFCFLRDRRVGIAGGSVAHLECGHEGIVARYMRSAQVLWSGR